MRILKIILAGVLFFCLLLLLLYTFLLDETANFFVHQSGLDDFHLQGIHLGRHSSTVDSCRVSLALPGGDRLEVIMRGTTISYDVQQALESGKAGLAEIDEVILKLTRKTGAETAAVTLPDRIVFLKEELRAALPLQRLRIGKLLLSGDFPTPLLGKTITLDLGISGTELELLLSAQFGPKLFTALHMKSPNSQKAEATIRVRDLQGETFLTQVLLTPEAVSATTEFEMHDLQSLIQLGETAVILPDMAGTIALRLDFPLNSVSQKEVLMTLFATDLEYQGFTCATTRLHLATTVGEGGVDFGPDSRVLLEKLRGNGVEINELSLGLGGSVRWQKEVLDITFSSAQRIAVNGLQAAGVQLGDLELGFETPLQLRIEEGRWAVADNILVVSALQLSRGEFRLESDSIRCGFSGITQGLSAPILEVNSARIAFTDAIYSLALSEVHGQLLLAEEMVHGKLQFVPELFGGQLHIDFSHGGTSGAGKFAISTLAPLQFSRVGATLSAVSTAWSYPFDLETGTLTFLAQGSYAADMDPKLRLWVDINDGGGYFQEFLFTGLGVKQEFSLLPDMGVEGGGHVTLEHLVGGLDSYDIQADVQLGLSDAGALPMVKVDNFSASLLGGGVSSSAIVYDPNAPDSSFVVDIRSIGLGQLVSLVDMENLLVTGAISGAIPVRVHGNEITVSNGELHSDGAGGEIRYTPGMINSTGITGYALRAVENLQYEKIKVTADYAASGQLDLLIAIQGRSPGLNTTRPVHLNINAEQNLPALLKSLRFSKGLTEELDKRVKRHYN